MSLNTGDASDRMAPCTWKSTPSEEHKVKSAVGSVKECFVLVVLSSFPAWLVVFPLNMLMRVRSLVL